MSSEDSQFTIHMPRSQTSEMLPFFIVKIYLLNSLQRWMSVLLAKHKEFFLSEQETPSVLAPDFWYL